MPPGEFSKGGAIVAAAKPSKDRALTNPLKEAGSNDHAIVTVDEFSSRFPCWLPSPAKRQCVVPTNELLVFSALLCSVICFGRPT
jgi:hypothetical protein